MREVAIGKCCGEMAPSDSLRGCMYDYHIAVSFFKAIGLRGYMYAMVREGRVRTYLFRSNRWQIRQPKRYQEHIAKHHSIGI